MIDAVEIEKRYREILGRVSHAVLAAKRDPKTVRLVVVSKTHPIDSIEVLYRLGHRDFGENYVQELVQKAGLAQTRGLSEVRWHYIGHLQSNKVKVVLPYIHLIHSVDSLSLAEEISKRAQNSENKSKIPCLLSVNIDQESTKSGFLPESLSSTIREISKLNGVELRGLMCIPDPEKVHTSPSPFARLRALGELLRGFSPQEFSMGMTSDFEQAILDGATLIRIGTAIFGERK